MIPKTPGELITQTCIFYKINIAEVAEFIDMPLGEMLRIVQNKRPINLLIASQLERALWIDRWYWINLQNEHHQYQKHARDLSNT